MLVLLLGPLQLQREPILRTLRVDGLAARVLVRERVLQLADAIEQLRLATPIVVGER